MAIFDLLFNLVFALPPFELKAPLCLEGRLFPVLPFGSDTKFMSYKGCSDAYTKERVGADSGGKFERVEN